MHCLAFLLLIHILMHFMYFLPLAGHLDSMTLPAWFLGFAFSFLFVFKFSYDFSLGIS